LKPPEDVTVTSLFLSSLSATSTELSIRTHVLQSLPSVQPTQLKSVVHVEKTRCAFVNFKDRSVAETAAQAWANGLEVDGERIAVKWGRSRPKQPSNLVGPSEASPSVAASAS
jgi:pre-mRNA-splicing factor RBM22/SLT11